MNEIYVEQIQTYPKEIIECIKNTDVFTKIY